MTNSIPALHTSLLTTRMTVAECLEQVLVDHGVRLAATIPGGPLMPLLRAVHSRRRIRTVLTRHEGGAAMLAEGYFRVGRRPGAVFLTAGPGVTNAVSGIALAQSEQTPFVVISAQVATDAYGRGAAQELDTHRLLEPITKASVSLVDPIRAQETLESLLRVATTARPGPVHLSVPANLWSAPTEYRITSSRGRIRRWSDTTRDQLLELLLAARSPCVLAGYGVVLARAERALLALANRIPALRVACSPRAKGAFPELHPRSLGVFGFAGHETAERAILHESDLVLVLGSRMGEITSLGWDARWNSRRIVQVDVEASALGKNVAIELGIAGDLGDVLRGTSARRTSSRKPLPRFDGVRSTQFVATPTPPPFEGEPAPKDPASRSVTPRQVMDCLNRVLSGNEHVFIDIGNTMAWAVHYLRRDRARRWHINLSYGCMGHSLPAAIGGALAQHEPVVALIGDAAFAMTGFELHTAVENQLPLIVIVMNDGGHGMVEMGSEVQFGLRAVPSARFRHRIQAAGLAVSLGASGVMVDSAELFETALRRALGTSRPVVLDVAIDPRETPPFGSRMKLLRQNFAIAERKDTAVVRLAAEVGHA